MKKRFLFKFFALLLCMLMGVVHGVKANRCFTQYWGVNTENIHHPTPTEPYLAFNVLFYDENSGDSFFLNANSGKGGTNYNNGGDGKHRGVAIYVDGNYICSDNYFYHMVVGIMVRMEVMMAKMVKSRIFVKVSMAGGHLERIAMEAGLKMVMKQP